MSNDMKAAPAAATRFDDLIKKLERVSSVVSGVDQTLRQGDFEAAWRLLRAAADSIPDSGLAQYGLAVITAASGDLVGAIKHADRATELLPDDVNAWRLLAELNRERARQEEQRSLKARSSLSQVRSQLSHGEQSWSSVEEERKALRKVREFLNRLVAYSSIVPIRVIDGSKGQELIRVEGDDYEGTAVYLERIGYPPEAALLRAFDRAFHEDPYDCATLLYQWLKKASSGTSVRVSLPAAIFFESYDLRHRTFEIVIYLRGAASSIEDRVEQLLQLNELNRRLSALFALGRNSRALVLSEGLVMAAARYFGWLGQANKILPKVTEMLDGDFGWASGVRTVHLKAIKHCLELIQLKQPIPPHLQKFVSEDDAYLKERICANPFTRFDMIHPGLGVRDMTPVVQVCCTHWLPTVIGTLADGADAVLNSAIVQDIRRSMLDGSFKYCDHLNCQSLVNSALPLKSDVTDPELRKAIDTGDVSVERARDILFAIDDSCNLSCPSCRVAVRGASREQNRDLMKVVEKTVLPLLGKASSVMINPAGELMVSEPSRAVLRYISEQTTPNLKVSIITNGTRFSEEEWNKFPGIHGKIEYIRVSLDGVRKETFEKLRRGASYDETWKNLEFLSRMRQSGQVPALYYSFTYQRDNFREMPEFVQMGSDHCVDGILFERLMNMGAYTSEEYRERAVHMLDHPLYPEFQQVLRDPLMRKKIVLGDLAHLVTDVGWHEPGSLICGAPLLSEMGGYSVEGGRIETVHSDSFPVRRRVDFLAEDSSKGRHRVEVSVGEIKQTMIYTPSFCVKPGGRSKVMLEMRDSDSRRYGLAKFDLPSRRVDAKTGDIVGANIDDEGSGWYRISAAMPFDTPPAVFNITLMDEDDGHFYQGDGRSGAFIRDFSFTCGELLPALGSIAEAVDESVVIQNVLRAV
jgi:MoaA/NifB/PqqE/SkfB family radical SAM enzyme/tetratricopeptide (TPR) repeat protein